MEGETQNSSTHKPHTIIVRILKSDGAVLSSFHHVDCRSTSSKNRYKVAGVIICAHTNRTASLQRNQDALICNQSWACNHYNGLGTYPGLFAGALVVGLRFLTRTNVESPPLPIVNHVVLAALPRVVAPALPDAPARLDLLLALEACREDPRRTLHIRKICASNLFHKHIQGLKQPKHSSAIRLLDLCRLIPFAQYLVD